MSDSLKAHIALSFVALLYGLNYVIAKDVLSLGYMTPSGFIQLRAASGAILFYIFNLLFIREKMELKDILYTAFCSVFGVMVNMLAFFEGLKLTSPIHASLIMITTPILVLIASAIIVKEKITLNRGIAIFLGFVGCCVLILSGGSSSNTQASIWGDILIFINASSFGIYLVIVRRLLKKYNPFTVVKWLFLFGSIFILPFGASDLVQTNWETFTTQIWLAVAYVVLGTTFLTYLGNAFALSKVPATTVGFYIYFQPFIASIAALSLGRDKINFVMIVAAAFLFGGVYLATKPQKKG